MLQNLINKQWIGTQSGDKAEVRQFLNDYLLSHHKKLPTYIRNKLVKVIVDVGRVDWPHFYPNFFSNIIEVGLLFPYCELKSNILSCLCFFIIKLNEKVTGNETDILQYLKATVPPDPLYAPSGT